jgi:DNA repair exonuclease SbcCD nuclease subunit
VPTARFLQISDLHLGAPLGWLPLALRRARRREQQRALETAVVRAIERQVDAILLPGDLFDRDAVDAESIAFAVTAFGVPRCPPVLVAPGNHDPWFENNPCWSGRLLEARGLRWPDHVHVFSSGAWTSVELPGKPIEVWGRCDVPRVAAAERPLDRRTLPPLAPDPGRVRVALFHGSREGFLPSGQKLTAPFHDAEAWASPFDYLAVGHYHLASDLRGDDGTVKLAYAGSPIALDLGEVGAHGALEVLVERHAHGAWTTTTPLVLDDRRVLALEVDVTGAASADQIDRRIDQALRAHGVSERDLATVRLVGRLTRGVRWSGDGELLEVQPFYLRLDAARMRPDYDLEAYRREPPRSTEDRFARALLERLDGEADPERRALFESALYHGLDAFRLGEVRPGYEELNA